MSNTAIQCIVAVRLGMLWPKPSGLGCSITDLGFFRIIHKMGLDMVPAYVEFFRGKEVDWSCIDLKNPFFPHCCHSAEPNAFARK